MDIRFLVPFCLQMLKIIAPPDEVEQLKFSSRKHLGSLYHLKQCAGDLTE